ncbi:hypothetical protein [Legionella micdadei]|uniref:Uncharacterized protein n=1 Tax=Legionella micdadei TaxID=451 RepID=A0A098GCY5_LEGMI|nr:hypothetical protein [Legionella micdadei]ARG98028.1 hypothetical protein B6N58_10345 [Legionella micdadei]KTD30148.1 hypothetical protein Lmic_0329 [Legionella micdadei]NSL18477.1 hypothetical protein [Legionella micdadei]CEG60344.1 protein of unknown function [Legionella micdadei]SCY55903.1 hypothetical protein SAMN02982997_02038 [Legionella micdadei]
MPKKIKTETSIEIHEETLEVANKHSWIADLSVDALQQKLIFTQCVFNALPLSRLLFELKNKYTSFEFVNSAVLGDTNQQSLDITLEFDRCQIPSDANTSDSMHLLFAKLANMLKRAKPKELIVVDSQGKYDIGSLPWKALIDNLLHTNSSFTLDIRDEEGRPFRLQLNKHGQVSRLKELLISSNEGEELTIPLPGRSPLTISFSKGKLSIKQTDALEYSSETEGDKQAGDAIVSSHILFYYLTQAAKLAKEHDFSLEINVFINHGDRFVYNYDAKTCEGDCQIDLISSGFEAELAVEQEELVASRLPRLLANLPGVTQFQLFCLNSQLLRQTAFVRELLSPVFANLEKLEITGSFETQESKALFLHALREFNHLRELVILGQLLSDEDMTDIAYLLKGKDKLKEVTLNGCNITNEGMKRLAEELQRLSRCGYTKYLNKLNIANNNHHNSHGYNETALKDFLKILKLCVPREIAHDFENNKKIAALMSTLGEDAQSYEHPVFGWGLKQLVSKRNISSSVDTHSIAGDESGYSPRDYTDSEDEFLSTVSMRRLGSQIRHSLPTQEREKLDIREEKNALAGISNRLVQRRQIIKHNRYRMSYCLGERAEEERAEPPKPFRQN